MKSSQILLSTIVTLFGITHCATSSGAETDPDLLAKSGVKGGLIVHVGCAGGEFTTEHMARRIELFDAKSGKLIWKKNRRRRAKSKVNYVWSTSIDIYPRAMLLTGEALFMAGPGKVDDFFVAACKNRLYFATVDGRVVCWK